MKSRPTDQSGNLPRYRRRIWWQETNQSEWVAKRQPGIRSPDDFWLLNRLPSSTPF